MIELTRWDQKFYRMKVPGSEKYPRTFIPRSEGSRDLYELSLLGANWPTNKKAVIH